MALGLNNDVTDLTRIRRLTYFGHVAHMSTKKLPHIALYGPIDESWPDKDQE